MYSNLICSAQWPHHSELQGAKLVKILSGLDRKNGGLDRKNGGPDRKNAGPDFDYGKAACFLKKYVELLN